MKDKIYCNININILYMFNGFQINVNKKILFFAHVKNNLIITYKMDYLSTNWSNIKKALQ